MLKIANHWKTILKLTDAFSFHVYVFVALAQSKQTENDFRTITFVHYNSSHSHIQTKHEWTVDARVETHSKMQINISSCLLLIAFTLPRIVTLFRCIRFVLQKCRHISLRSTEILLLEFRLLKKEKRETVQANWIKWGKMETRRKNVSVVCSLLLLFDSSSSSSFSFA